MILRSNRNFPFKKFPSLSQFCIVIDSIAYRYRVFRVIFNLRRYFSMKVFFFSRETKKQNSIRFQTNFTDYKYFLPAILSINRKIKKKKKRRQYIHHQRAENESQNLLYLRSRGPSIFLHSTPPCPLPLPLIRNTNNFSSSVFPVHFILFHGPLPPAENRFSGHSLP